MRTAFFFSLLAFAILVVSCGSEPEMEQGETTPNGFKYTLHTNADGVKPKPTDYAFIHMYGYYDDSLTYSTRIGGEMIRVEVPDWANLQDKDLIFGKTNPVTDILAYMTVGDSATIFVPIDTALIVNDPRLAKVKKQTYDIVLYDVMSASDYIAKYGTGDNPTPLVAPDGNKNQ